ncbi:MAG: amidohydrolase family protein [Myxococcota bacterium]|nr:amidohydrolase family protein [Myxococcota bacterium]
MTRHLVVSSDCHAGLQPERYREYLDPQYRERFDTELALQIAQREEMARLFLVDEFNESWQRDNSELLAGAWDHDKRIEVLDTDGIAVEIVFPDGITEFNSPPFEGGLGLPTEGADPELQWAGARSHNRWLAELCQMAPERRIGVALVPVWDIDEAVREVEWARANGLGGVMLPVMWGKLPPYHTRHYEPLWQACTDNQMVVHFHSGPGPRDDYFAMNTDGTLAEGAVGIYVSEVCFYLVRPLTFMIWGGVFDRHPELRVAITEGSCIWVPEYLKLLDHRFTAHRANAKMGDFTSHLKRSPSETFHDCVAVGASVLARREVELREEIGTRCIMWGSDYPHPEGSWPDTRDEMVTALRGLPEAEIAAILGGNAARFYDLDTEKLAPLVARIGPEQSLFD